jgi:2-polyprenyl-3-methyl-5-hydroxy-6-metoxy-1,4-benzoquinol methylase
LPESEETQNAGLVLKPSKYQDPYEIRRTRIVERLIPQGSGDKALDVGCGTGHFCKVLTDRGWETTAIDSDSASIVPARAHARETHVGDAAAVLSKLPGNQYGLVLALEIVEHMPQADAEELLDWIHRVLKPKGRLILSTPNRLSMQGLGGYHWKEKIRRQERWTAWDPTHVRIYSSSEILRLVKSKRFVVDGITGYHYEGTLPLIGHFRFPFVTSRVFPFNRFGFNIIIECRKT